MNNDNTTIGRWQVVNAIQGGLTVVNFANLAYFQGTNGGANLFFTGVPAPLHVENRIEQIPILMKEAVTDIALLADRMRTQTRAVA